MIAPSLLLTESTAVMLESQEAGAMAFGITANTPIIRGLAG